VCRFARHRKTAVQILVEWHAVGEEVAYPLVGFLGHASRHRFVHQARTGGNSVARMRFRRVAFRHGGGDAALRPGGGRAFADRRGCQHGDGMRRELQRAEQPGQSAADDEDIG
jgi:hypothetical protein